MADPKEQEFMQLFGSHPAFQKKPQMFETPEAASEYFQKGAAVRAAQEEAARQKAAEPAPVSDYGKAATAGAQQAALSLPGTFGDISSMYAAVPSFAAKSAEFVREKLGIPFSAEQKAQLESSAQKGGEAMKELGPFGAKYIAAPVKRGLEYLGIPSDLVGLPSTEELAKKAQPYGEKYFGVGPEYEPKTKGEAVVKSGLAYGLPSVIGGPKGVLPRTIAGVGGAGASEYAGQQLKGTQYEYLEPYARLGTAMVAPLALEKTTAPFLKLAEGAVTPERMAAGQLGEGLSDYAAESSGLAYKMSKADQVARTAAGMQDRMRSFTRNLLGVDQSAPEFANAVDRLGRVDRDNIYTLVKSRPDAQAIDTSLFSDLAGQSVFMKAVDRAVENGANVPEWGIVPPKVTAGKKGGTYQGETGLYTVPDSPPTISHGNLAFYDQVKRELDSVIEQAMRTGDTTALASAKNAKQKLVGILDNVVPEYKDARGIASDTFLTASAPEAGSKFLTTSDMYGLDEFKNAFNSYNNAQKQAFRVGLMGRLEQEIATKNPETITNRFLNNPQFMDKFNFAFGPKVAAQIRSKVLAENMLQQADKIRRNLSSAENLRKAQQYEGLKNVGIAGATATALGELANSQFLLQGLLGISPATAMFAAGAAGATFVGQKALSLMDRRIANRMIELIKSNDPKQFGKLNALIDKHPDLYPYMMNMLQAVDQGTRAMEGIPERPQLPEESVEQSYERLVKEGKIKPTKANGGRVARADGGKIDAVRGARALMRAAENAKKNISKTTETLLDQPDEHIAQALNVAKRHI